MYNMGNANNPRMVSQGGLAAMIAGAKKSPAQSSFLGGNVPKFQDAMREGVQGYGNMVTEDMAKQVGMQLGDLNSIGALRSGAVQTGINDAATAAGRQVGNYASMATKDALGMAQQENDSGIERNFRQQQYNDAKKASKQRGFGKLVGGALGLASFIPGPIGAAAKIGSAGMGAFNKG